REVLIAFRRVLELGALVVAFVCGLLLARTIDVRRSCWRWRIGQARVLQLHHELRNRRSRIDDDIDCIDARAAPRPEAQLFQLDVAPHLQELELRAHADPALRSGVHGSLHWRAKSLDVQPYA